MSALQEDCKKGQKWVSCTLVVFQSAYMADIQCRLIIRRQVASSSPGINYSQKNTKAKFYGYGEKNYVKIY